MFIIIWEQIKDCPYFLTILEVYKICYHRGVRGNCFLYTFNISQYPDKVGIKKLDVYTFGGKWTRTTIYTLVKLFDNMHNSFIKWIK